MVKKSVPLGFCKDCRWSRELPPDMKLGPFEYDCQAMPWQFEPHQQESKVRDPKTGKSMVQMSMVYLAHPQQAHNYCALFEARPTEASGDAGDSGDGEGLL